MKTLSHGAKGPATAKTLGMMGLFAAAFGCFFMGCASQSENLVRELSALRQEVATMRAAQGPTSSPATAAPDYPMPPPAVQQPQAAITPPGPQALPMAPNPAAAPPLPVVKLDPNRSDPFVDGREPTIRIGKTGRLAPPASKKKSGSLEYTRIDEQGNLWDREGTIVYRAGLDSPVVDTETPSPEEEADRIYEQLHASPSSHVERGTRAPRIMKPGEPYSHEGRHAKAGVINLANGEILEDASVRPGVSPVHAPRIKQVSLRDRGLPDDRDFAIRVDDSPEMFAMASPASVQTAGDEVAQAGLAAPSHHDQAQAAHTAPVAAAASRPAPDLSKLKQPTVAPGPHQPIIQKPYSKWKDRKAKQLYEKARRKFKKGYYKEAKALFETILKKYSAHDLADNALYWLAETAYVEGEWLVALAWFQDVVARYPEGNKLPDAMLKSGLCYARLGEVPYALQTLVEVETLFGSEPVAKIARERRLALSQGGTR